MKRCYKLSNMKNFWKKILRHTKNTKSTFYKYWLDFLISQIGIVYSMKLINKFKLVKRTKAERFREKIVKQSKKNIK